MKLAIIEKSVITDPVHRYTHNLYRKNFQTEIVGKVVLYIFSYFNEPA